jgi:two-component sensor histidine kinase
MQDAEGNIRPERAFQLVFGSIVALGTISFISSIFWAIEIGTWGLLAAYSGLYLLSLLVLFHNGLPLQLRVVVSLCVIYLLGVNNLLHIGLVSSGRIYLFSLPIISGFFFGIRGTLIAFLVSSLSFLILVVLVHTGVHTSASPPLVWRTTFFTFATISLAISLSFSLLLTKLRQQLQQQQELNIQLQQTNTENEILLKEIHHRVKNNLQVISSLLSLQSRRMETEIDRERLLKSQLRILSMAKIHELLYGVTDFAHINLEHYFTSMGKAILHSGIMRPSGPISIDFQSEVETLSLEKAMPCALIYCELVTNSMKYAYPGAEGGTIHVRLTLENGKVVLDYRDDGHGFEPESIAEESGSLGMTLVRVLTEQLGGELTASGDQGAHFQIRFPA